MLSGTGIMPTMPLHLQQAASQVTAMQVLSSACMLFASVLTDLQLDSYQSATTSGNNARQHAQHACPLAE